MVTVKIKQFSKCWLSCYYTNNITKNSIHTLYLQQSLSILLQFLKTKTREFCIADEQDVSQKILLHKKMYHMIT